MFLSLDKTQDVLVFAEPDQAARMQSRMMLLSLETRNHRYVISLDTFSADFDDIEEILRWQFWFINEEIERTVGIDERGRDEEVRRVAGVTPERRSRS